MKQVFTLSHLLIAIDITCIVLICKQCRLTNRRNKGLLYGARAGSMAGTVKQILFPVLAGLFSVKCR